MKFWLFSKNKIWFLILLFILAGLMIDLTSRIYTLNTLTGQKETLAAEVVQLTATVDALQERIAYAGSDAAVEAWARQQGLMMQDGDHVIIPLPWGTPLPTATPLPTPTPVQYQNWEIWKALIFD